MSVPHIGTESLNIIILTESCVVSSLYISNNNLINGIFTYPLIQL